MKRSDSPASTPPAKSEAQDQTDECSDSHILEGAVAIAASAALVAETVDKAPLAGDKRSGTTGKL